MKKSVKNLKIVDAKVEDFKPTTLDQVWGEASTGYQTNDSEEYQNFLKELGTADLQAHAIKSGVLPTESRERTVKRLIAKFKQSVAENRPLPAGKASKSPSEEIRRILSEGR